MRNRLTFQNRANRDTKYKELKAAGHNPTRSRSTNQLLHPQYVTDYDGLEKHDTGLGNTVYKTHFGRLYHLEWE